MLSDKMECMNPVNDHCVLSDNDLLKRLYLSKSYTLGKDSAYQFWTFCDWNRKDGRNLQRGIDRFVFIPGKGIVGSSFDF